MKKRIIIVVLSFFLPLLYAASPAFASGFTVSNVTYNSVTHVLNFDYSGYDLSTVPNDTYTYLEDQTIGDDSVDRAILIILVNVQRLTVLLVWLPGTRIKIQIRCVSNLLMYRKKTVF